MNNRYDFYAAIHKAVRFTMAQTLIDLGRADASDPVNVRQTLDRVRALVEFSANHIGHEDAHVHPAIRARAANWDGQTAVDHEHHALSFDLLRRCIAAVERAPAGERAAALTRLYREVAVFMAEDLLHMAVEEGENNRVLWAHYSDSELQEIEHTIVATMQPDEAANSLRLILLAATPADRAATLDAVRRTAPPEVYDGALEAIRFDLSLADRQKLAVALDDMAKAA